MNPLLSFYNNIHEKEAVKKFFQETLEAMAVERVFEKKDIAGIYEAKRVLDDSFDKLDTLYGKIKETKPTSPR